MSIICTICARGGSKGVPGKNVKIIAGKPLISHTIEKALAANIFDTIVVTSDSDEILSLANGYKSLQQVKRPTDLATDEAGKIPAIQHAVSAVEERAKKNFAFIVDLDVTCPLREVSDITGAIELCKKESVDNVVSGALSRKSPYFNLVEESGEFVKLAKDPGGLLLRRQDAPKCYDLNGSVYVWKRDALFSSKTVIGSKTAIFEMPEERSIDIDTQTDFELVQHLMTLRG